MMNSSLNYLSLEETQRACSELNNLLDTLNKIDDDANLFYDMSEIRELTGWSKKTVEDLFNNPAFPSTDIGKRKLVLKFAFVNFFMQRRDRENKDIWR